MRTQPELGRFIAKLRLERGMTQADMADRICIARSTLAGYERGSIQPTTFILLRIAKCLDIDINALLGLDVSNITAKEPLDIFSIIERLTYNVSRKNYNKYYNRSLSDEDLDFLELQLKNLIATMDLYLSNKE